MTNEEIILKALKQSGEALSAGQLVEITGLDKKVVDKAMNTLKKEDKIFSPVRCCWKAK